MTGSVAVGWSAARRARAWDVIVAGAGPAGSMAARALALRGADVLLVDRQPFPRWKVCGSCLSAGALATLDSAGLGELAHDVGGVPLRRLRMFAGRRDATLRLGGSIALSRMALDAALVREAVGAGATFVAGTRAELEVGRGSGRGVRLVGRGEEEVVAGRVVVDATGLASTCREGRGDVTPGSRVGLGAVLASSMYDAPFGEVHMVIGRRGYVGLVRLGDGTLDVGAAVDPDALRDLTPGELVQEILHEAGRPALDGRLAHPWRGTPPLTRRAARPGGERLLRVGDAAGYVEPFTGEGIGWALAAGLAAAGVAIEGARRWDSRLERAWDDYQRRSMAPSRRLCRALAWGLRRPRLVRAGVAAAARAPVLAAPFLRRVASPPPSRVALP